MPELGTSWRTRVGAGFGAGLWSAAAGGGAGGLFFGRDWDWIEFAVRFALAGLLLPPAWAFGDRLGRRLGPRDPARLRRDAAMALTGPTVRTGQLPVGADPGRWLPALALVRKECTTVAGVAAVAGTVLTCVVVGSAVRVDPTDMGVWAVALVVVLATARVVTVGVRRRHTARRLEGQLSA